MRFRFTIRDLFWLTVVAALAIQLFLMAVEIGLLQEANRRLQFGGGMKQLHLATPVTPSATKS